MNRRGRNEGSIYQRRDGRWVGMLSVTTGGRRRRRAVYGETKREAQTKLKTAQRAVDDGLTVTNERTTVATFLARWLRESVTPTVRPRTVDSYAQLVRLHLAPEIGQIRLSRLTPADVQALMNRKLAAGLSPRTVQYLHAILRRSLRQALRWGFVTRNVAILVDPPRVRHPEIHPLSPDQARALLVAARGDRLEALYTVAMAVGLRQGEALGLRWQDVDLETGTLNVRVALQRRGPGWDLVEPKTARSRRSIALPAVVVAALRAHRIRQLQEVLWAGSRWQGARPGVDLDDQKPDLVFTSVIGTPLDGRNVTRRFQALLAAAGLPRQRYHDLRHLCATLLLAQGVHPRVVMETLGHSQIALTMNTYSHVIPALQRDAADQMDALLTAER